jgi:hypothetical protein
MKSKDILLIFVIIFAAGFSLYRKYARKNQPGAGSSARQPGSFPPSGQKDDDYEPYSGK